MRKCFSLVQSVEHIGIISMFQYRSCTADFSHRLDQPNRELKVLCSTFHVIHIDVFHVKLYKEVLIWKKYYVMNNKHDGLRR